jgi:hypothetical protein
MLHNDVQFNYIIHKWHSTLVCSRISSSCILNPKYMIFVISTLNITSLCILKRKNITSNTLMLLNVTMINYLSLKHVAHVGD